jgi:hypothetical protein
MMPRMMLGTSQNDAIKMYCVECIQDVKGSNKQTTKVNSLVITLVTADFTLKLQSGVCC